LQALWRIHQRDRRERQANRRARGADVRRGKKQRPTRKPAYADVRVQNGE
jgi:hypothetical protein